MDVGVSIHHHGFDGLPHVAALGSLPLQHEAVAGSSDRGVHGHPMPALLSGDLQVRQAHLPEGVHRELALAALDLLQAQHVGGLFLDEAGGLFGAQADGVDVPGADSQTHRGLLAGRSRNERRPGRRASGPDSCLSCRRREGIGSGTDFVSATGAPTT